MDQAATRRLRETRRGCRRRVCAFEKRSTGIFRARTGHRFYNPDNGRWLNRDPYGEISGRNPYCLVDNESVNYVDVLGLFKLLPPDPNKNTVVCDGSGGFKIQLGNSGTPEQAKCLKSCYEAHEKSHIDDIKKKNPDLCKNQPAGTTVGPDDQMERAQTEKKAYQAEIDCLEKKLKALREKALGGEDGCPPPTSLTPEENKCRGFLSRQRGHRKRGLRAIEAWLKLQGGANN